MKTSNIITIFFILILSMAIVQAGPSVPTGDLWGMNRLQIVNFTNMTLHNSTIDFNGVQITSWTDVFNGSKYYLKTEIDAQQNAQNATISSINTSLDTRITTVNNSLTAVNASVWAELGLKLYTSIFTTENTSIWNALGQRYLKTEVYNKTEIDAQQIAQNNTISALDTRESTDNTTQAAAIAGLISSNTSTNARIDSVNTTAVNAYNLALIANGSGSSGYALAVIANQTATTANNTANTVNTRELADNTTQAIQISNLNDSIYLPGFYYCYQEATNTTNQTGIDGNCNLNYSGNYLIGGSGGTPASGTFESNYIKPPNAVSALWTVKHGTLGAYNISLPLSCWNYNATSIKVRLVSKEDTAIVFSQSYPECYNGSWIPVGTETNTSNGCGGTDIPESYKLWDGNWSTEDIAQRNTGGWRYDWCGTLPAMVFEEAMNWYIVPNSLNNSLRLLDLREAADNSTQAALINTKLNITDQRYNDTAYVDSKLTSYFYNATTVNVITGTPQGDISMLQTYNNIPYNVSEVNSDLEFIVNFTNVTTFNQLVIRYAATAGDTHSINVYLWDYNASAWEGYTLLGGDDGSYIVNSVGVFDYTDHVQNGTVRVRLYTSNVGASTDKWQFDWIAISRGPATPSVTETDPLSLHRDGSTPLTGNWNAGNYNITVDNINANTSWTNLKDYPAACSAGYAITQVGDSNTCSAFLTSTSSLDSANIINTPISCTNAGVNIFTTQFNGSTQECTALNVTAIDTTQLNGFSSLNSTATQALSIATTANTTASTAIQGVSRTGLIFEMAIGMQSIINATAVYDSSSYQAKINSFSGSTYSSIGGPYGNGYENFIGNNTYSQATDAPQYNLTGQFTIVAIIKPYTNVSGAFIVSHISGSGGLGYSLEQSAGYTMRVRIGNGTGNTPSSTGNALLNQWNFIAVSYTNISGSGYYVFDVNGVLNSGTTASFINTTSSPLRIGAHSGQTPGNAFAAHFNGTIAYIAIYNQSLSNTTMEYMRTSMYYGTAPLLNSSTETSCIYLPYGGSICGASNCLQLKSPTGINVTNICG